MSAFNHFGNYAMRIAAFSLLLSASFFAYAEQPLKNEPVPPPPMMADGANVDEQEVTISKKSDMTIEEYRIGGKLYMIKVTPKYGKPYYLVDDRGDGKFARQESLDSGFRVPRWIIHNF
jgi:hypothetical protein